MQKIKFISSSLPTCYLLTLNFCRFTKMLVFFLYLVFLHQTQNCHQVKWILCNQQIVALRKMNNINQKSIFISTLSK